MPAYQISSNQYQYNWQRYDKVKDSFPQSLKKLIARRQQFDNEWVVQILSGKEFKNISYDECQPKSDNYTVYIFKLILSYRQDKQFFVCNFCQAAYQTEGKFYDHLRSHTQEHPFVCKICNMTFTQKSNLGSHVRQHNGQKKYQCENCGKQFFRRFNLKLH